MWIYPMHNYIPFTPLFNFHHYRNNRVLPDNYYEGVTQMLRKGCTAVIIQGQSAAPFLTLFLASRGKSGGMRSARDYYSVRGKEKIADKPLAIFFSPSFRQAFIGLLVSGTYIHANSLSRANTRLSTKWKTTLTSTRRRQAPLSLAWKSVLAFNRGSVTRCFQGKHSVYRIAFIMRTERVKRRLESSRAPFIAGTINFPS